MGRGKKKHSSTLVRLTSWDSIALRTKRPLLVFAAVLSVIFVWLCVVLCSVVLQARRSFRSFVCLLLFCQAYRGVEYRRRFFVASSGS